MSDTTIRQTIHVTHTMQSPEVYVQLTREQLEAVKRRLREAQRQRRALLQSCEEYGADTADWYDLRDLDHDIEVFTHALRTGKHHSDCVDFLCMGDGRAEDVCDDDKYPNCDLPPCGKCVTSCTCVPVPDYSAGPNGPVYVDYDDCPF